MGLRDKHKKWGIYGLETLHLKKTLGYGHQQCEIAARKTNLICLSITARKTNPVLGCIKRMYQ